VAARELDAGKIQEEMGRVLSTEEEEESLVTGFVCNCNVNDNLVNTLLLECSHGEIPNAERERRC
jgi:hypothetical protein